MSILFSLLLFKTALFVIIGIFFLPCFCPELGFRGWIKWCKNRYFGKKHKTFAFKRKGFGFLLNVLKLIFTLIQAWEQHDSKEIGQRGFSLHFKGNRQILLI